MFTHYYRHMRYATYTYTALDNTSVLHTRDPTRVAKNASETPQKRFIRHLIPRRAYTRTRSRRDIPRTCDVSVSALYA